MTVRQRQGLGLALGAVVAFSFSLPWTVWALESFAPVLTATGRAAIAGVIALVILIVRRVPRPTRAQVRPLLYTMAGAVFGWPILIALALERTTSAHAAVIAAVMPLVTAIIAVLRTRENVATQFCISQHVVLYKHLLLILKSNSLCISFVFQH